MYPLRVCCFSLAAAITLTTGFAQDARDARGWLGSEPPPTDLTRVKPGGETVVEEPIPAASFDTFGEELTAEEIEERTFGSIYAVLEVLAKESPAEAMTQSIYRLENSGLLTEGRPEGLETSVQVLYLLAYNGLILRPKGLDHELQPWVNAMRDVASKVLESPQDFREDPSQGRLSMARVLFHIREEVPLEHGVLRHILTATALAPQSPYSQAQWGFGQVLRDSLTAASYQLSATEYEFLSTETHRAWVSASAESEERSLALGIAREMGERLGEFIAEGESTEPRLEAKVAWLRSVNESLLRRGANLSAATRQALVDSIDDVDSLASEAEEAANALRRALDRV